MIGPLTPAAVEAAAEAGWARFHEILRLSNPGMPPMQTWKREDEKVRAIYRAMVVAAHAALVAFNAASADQAHQLAFDQAAQGARCGCRGYDEMCVCQNVADAETRKAAGYPA